MSVDRLAAAFVCPLCSGRFTLRHERTLVCPAGHAFDLAREGYVNLVPPQDKRSKEPGYNADLIRARHDFFDDGGYRELAEAMADEVLAGLGDVPSSASASSSSSAAGKVLDAGCGEGYYLRVLRERAAGLDLIGTDLSKPGVRIASRLDPAGAYAVANSFRLPVADDSLDLVVSHFSPIPTDELARVLRPGGVLLTGSPGADHLFDLKALVYDTPTRHDEGAHRIADPRFVPGSRRVVRYRLRVDDPAMLAALFAMTPFAYGANTGVLDDAASGVFGTDVHVLFDRYRFQP